MVELRITVTLKKTVEDSEGGSVLKALKLLGYDNVKDVKTGKVYFITLTKGSKEVGQEICERLLANPVINECVVDD
jgi:phosphoribosylformylglycinamidine synthase